MGETSEFKEMIWPRMEAEYFSREVWTGQITLEALGKLIFRRIERSIYGLVGQFDLYKDHL